MSTRGSIDGIESGEDMGFPSNLVHESTQRKSKPPVAVKHTGGEKKWRADGSTPYPKKN
jgi:hypothetical protein